MSRLGFSSFSFVAALTTLMGTSSVSRTLAAQEEPTPAEQPPGSPPAIAPAQSPPPTAAPASPSPVRPPLVLPNGTAPSSSPATPSQPPSSPASPALAPVPMEPASTPSTSQGALSSSGDSTGGLKGAIGTNPSEVYSEDWWGHTHPIFEIHGYYRLRAELFHNFFLGRSDVPEAAIWAPPIDYSYTDRNGTPHQVNLCGKDPLAAPEPCTSKTQAGANMRFRLAPELHLSDNLRIFSQVDLLDNLVLGSTPGGYYNTSGGSSANAAGNPPRSVFASTTDVPTAGQNSFSNSVSVKRVWGEYMTPLGLLRFGRQPDQWGLGILHNAGDGYDSDWQSTVDRVMFVSGVKSLDLYAAGAWDFPHSGATSATASERQGQPYDLGQLDDVNQYSVMLVRRRSADLTKQDLALGRVVINGGVYFTYRNQFLANDSNATGGPTTNGSLGQTYATLQSGLVRRNAQLFTPDLWAQLLYRKFRFEVEAVTTQGTLENTSNQPGYSPKGPGDYDPGIPFGHQGWNLRQYMVATQAELKAVEDKLRIQFGFGWASGDPDMLGLTPTGSGDKLGQTTYNRTLSMAQFHPDYRVDLILFRNILSRVQGAYYFRPSVDYDFIRNLNGQKFGGGAAAIWSRASEFVQTPGHKRDLGIELDLSVYYQSKEGSFNDNPDKMGGFFTMLQYGVLFPLGGLGYQDGEKTRAAANGVQIDTSAAQTLRWYTGILF